MKQRYVGSDRTCWICGAPATVKRDLANPQTLFGQYLCSHPVHDDSQRCYCKKCFEETMLTLREENKQYILLKKKRMFERAVDRMEHQKIHLYDYKEAIDTVYDYLMENLDKFDSSYEIMAAIVLIHNHVHIKPQARVGRYQVDFMLDDDHIILEIDGDRHAHRKAYDSIRDESIRSELGTDWEVIRIKTECLDMKATKLMDAIEAVLDYRHRA